MQAKNQTGSTNIMNPEIKIYAIRLGSTPTELKMNLYLQQIPMEEQQRIGMMRSLRDRYRAIISVKLLSWGVRTYILGDKPLKVYRNKMGRPFLDYSFKWDGDFNLSHSGDWVVLAIVNTGKVGVDVEQIRKVDKSILLECLTETERRILYQKPEEDWEKMFYEIWTMKEALFKTGIDPILSLETVDISKYMTADENGWLKFKMYYLDQNHPVSVCWEYDSFPSKISIIDKGKIMNTL